MALCWQFLELFFWDCVQLTGCLMGKSALRTRGFLRGSALGGNCLRAIPGPASSKLFTGGDRRSVPSFSFSLGCSSVLLEDVVATGFVIAIINCFMKHLR